MIYFLLCFHSCIDFYMWLIPCQSFIGACVYWFLYFATNEKPHTDMQEPCLPHDELRQSKTQFSKSHLRVMWSLQISLCRTSEASLTWSAGDISVCIHPVERVWIGSLMKELTCCSLMYLVMSDTFKASGVDHLCLLAEELIFTFNNMVYGTSSESLWFSISIFSSLSHLPVASDFVFLSVVTLGKVYPLILLNTVFSAVLWRILALAKAFCDPGCTGKVPGLQPLFPQ